MPSPRENVIDSWSHLYQHRIAVRRRFPDLWKLPIVKNPHQAVLRILQDGNKVLDIGAFDRQMGERLKQTHAHITYRSMDADRGRFHDYYSLEEVREVFDLLLLFEVIEHLELREGVELLTRMEGLLREGGRLVLTTPNIFHPNVYWWDATHKTPYRYDEIGGVLESVGYRISQIFRVYNDAVPRRWARLYLARPLYRFLGIDFCRSILVVAERPG